MSQRTKPRKPRTDHFICPHATGKWAKTIKAQNVFLHFGAWDDPEGGASQLR